MYKKLTSRKNKAIIFSLWDCLFSKNYTKVVLVVKNRTEFSGNLRVVSEILLSDDKYRIYIYKDGDIVPKIRKMLEIKGATVLEGWSIKSLYHLLTSGIFIFSHAPRDAHITKRCKKRTIINLWHGVAFKTIENLMPNIPKEKQEQIRNNAKLYDLIIASSAVDKQTNVDAFMLDEKKVHITGLPRYDILKDSYILDNFLKEQKEKLLVYKKDKKLILYAPTFREKKISALDQMSESDWNIISNTLEQNNAIMAIRPHAYDKALPVYLDNNENFFLLPHKIFTETNLILQFTDILIVDFSSIWIDFLLLNRPIVGFAKDLEHYLSRERGFVYDFESTFPDLFFHSTETLAEQLKVLLSKKDLTTQYKEASKKFHTYTINTNFAYNFKKLYKENMKISYPNIYNKKKY